jgi:kynurenine formamidase
MNRDALPAYRELPELGSLGIRHARDVLPLDAGTLSFIEPADVVAAAALVERGETIPLNLAVDAFAPPLFGRSALEHRIVQPTRNDSEDVLDAFNPQASSQLDGLAHVQAREFGYFDGSTDPAAARERIGMHHWAERGIAGRGVLLDLAVDDPFDGSTIGPDDLLAVARRERVDLRPGDILLVRTGWVAAYLARPEPRGESAWRGLGAGEDTAEFLWDHRVAVLGADNPAVEVSPGDPAVGSLHRRLLPALGLPLMELLDLERLAARCAELGRWSFLFTSVPLHLRGGVSSTANAMAVL